MTNSSCTFICWVSVEYSCTLQCEINMKCPNKTPAVTSRLESDMHVVAENNKNMLIGRIRCIYFLYNYIARYKQH